MFLNNHRSPLTSFPTKFYFYLRTALHRTMGWNEVREVAWDQLILVGLLRILYYTLSSLIYMLHEAMDFFVIAEKRRHVSREGFAQGSDVIFCPENRLQCGLTQSRVEVRKLVQGRHGGGLNWKVVAEVKKWLDLYYILKTKGQNLLIWTLREDRNSKIVSEQCLTQNPTAE